MKKITKKNITIADIAVLANVSKTTVSRYINGKHEYMSYDTRVKLQKIIDKYEYVPSNIAISLKTKSTKLIAFIVSDIENAFAAPTINAMTQGLVDTNYHILISSSNNSLEQEKLLVESVIKQRVDAILLNPVSHDSKYLKELKLNIPLILVDRKVKYLKTDIVANDSYYSMQNAITHLKEQGYNDIYIITEEYKDVEPRFRRIEGFKNKMIDYGYNQLNLDNYIKVVDLEDKDSTKVIIQDIMRKSKNVPGIICSNGRVLLSAAVAIKKLGLKMPNDLGLIGYDDFGKNSAHGWTELNDPSITRLSANWYELGKKTIELVKLRLDKPKGSKKEITIEVPLIVDGSTILSSR